MIAMTSCSSTYGPFAAPRFRSTSCLGCLTAVSPHVGIHTVEGLPLIGLPPARLPRSSIFLKRCIDLVGASLGLFVTAPALALIALLIKRD